MRHLAGWLVVAALLGGDGAAEAFRALQESCRFNDATVLRKAFPAEIGEAVAGKGAKEIDAWREDLAATLAKAEFHEVREAGDEAVARCLGPRGGEIELVLRRRKGDWSIAAPVAYLVEGKALDAVNGKGPAALRLAARTRNGEYGDSAFSFAHVTRRPEECANRMDLWYCHNGDLHAVADGRLARVAAKDLKSVAGIPEGAAWKATLAPEKGGVYVVHCRREGHRDFYVKARVTAIDEKEVAMEWAVLAAGFGSPATIDAPHPLVTRDGADGYDGICAKNRERSKPGPAPGKTAPTPR